MNDREIDRHMRVLRLDEAELASRRAFFHLGDDDLEKLAALRPHAERHSEAVVEKFYELLTGHATTRRFLADESTKRRLRETQRLYFLGLFAGRCDLDYVRERVRIGAAHERIGLDPTWYLGAYRRYLSLMRAMLVGELGPEGALDAFESLEKLVYFDVALACEAFVSAKASTIERHQAAIRELSTPVIRLHDRILLLPLVGAVDSRRAMQVMDNVLARVSETRAKVVIIDIAGVPVVDTRVADSLIKATAAVRLLGAQTILTGIGAQVARTMVQLGVELTTMHTRSRLSDGIDLALSLVGMQIVAQTSEEEP